MSNLVMLSGGADSAICAAIAARNDETFVVSFDYGQRHVIELESACKVADLLGLEHEIIDCKGILRSTSPLLSSHPVEQYRSSDELPDGIASTFVPVRNLVFLSIAANRAVQKGCDFIYTGVCQTDYSGYPDCRRAFIDATEQALLTALDKQIHIVTPLMGLTKAESILLAIDVMDDQFEAIMGATHTCYQGVVGGCGVCAACLLRDRGFKEVGVDDPIWRDRK